MTFLSLSAPRRLTFPRRITMIAIFDVAVLVGLAWLIAASDLFS